MPLDLNHIQSRIYEGDVQALKELYEAIGMPLLRLAENITGCHHLAEEVIQDVFVSIWQKRKKFITVENVKWYLYASTRNKSIQYLRANKHYKKVSLRDAPDLPDLYVDVSPEDLMITAEVMKRINKAINDLPPQCRLIFKMIKEDGLKYREAATLLDLSIKTVENQMGIALKKLHRAIAMNIPSYHTEKNFRKES